MLTNTNNTNGNTTKNPTVVIGINHGYGNIKTANTCFRAGVTAYDKEPYFIIGSLQYNGKWYVKGRTLCHAANFGKRIHVPLYT